MSEKELFAGITTTLNADVQKSIKDIQDGYGSGTLDYLGKVPSVVVKKARKLESFPGESFYWVRAAVPLLPGTGKGPWGMREVMALVYREANGRQRVVIIQHPPRAKSQ